MVPSRKVYRWLYDHVHCHYYDMLLKWCFLPLGGEDKVRRSLIDAVDVQEGDRVLDMCCGTGTATFLMASRAGEHAQIKGIDLSSGQIRIARKKNHFPNIEFMVMDASDTYFDEGYFDKVVIGHALHEMTRSTRLAVLKEARRVARDGGVLAVLEMDTPPNLVRHAYVGLWWFYWLPFNPESPTRRDMLRHTVVQELKEAGFRDVSKTSTFGGTLQVVQGRK